MRVHSWQQRPTTVHTVERASEASIPAISSGDYTVVNRHFQQENAMTRTAWFEEVQKNISDLIKRSPAADVERNVKAVLGTAFTKLDLVTREEFDIQVELLARSRARLEVLEDQLRALEQKVQGLSTPASSGTTSTPSASNTPPAPPSAV